MPNRRSFIAGMLAAGLLPKPTWADAGNPGFLSAGRKPDGTFVLCGLNSQGQITFEVPLPARGHAAAAHPKLAEAVAFARRPGTYAIVLNCMDGQEKARLEAPEGRHFYGHGTYSHDGDLLFTSENDYEAAQGVIGVWDVRARYRRICEFHSGGIGPHDIKLMPDGKSLVVANGGIETHPDMGRTKLNIPSMRPNLSYLDLTGQLTEQVELEGEHRKNSIRHLAVSDTSRVAFAMQWQGDQTRDLPLLGFHDRHDNTVRMAHQATIRRMSGYLGSIAITPDGTSMAVTSPRAGRVQVFHDTDLVRETIMEDVCGVAASDAGFMFTSGNGIAHPATGGTVTNSISWDNHLVPI